MASKKRHYNYNLTFYVEMYFLQRQGTYWRSGGVIQRNLNVVGINETHALNNALNHFNHHNAYDPHMYVVFLSLLSIRKQGTKYFYLPYEHGYF